MQLYKEEKVNFAILCMLVIGIAGMMFLVLLRITSPEGWEDGGFTIAIAFIGIFNIMIATITYLLYQKTKKFIQQRDEIIENGDTYIGEIETYERKVSYDSEDNTRTYHYFAIVRFNMNGEEIKYRTPELAFNPTKLVSKEVTVHVYENKYYVDGYKIQ